MVRRRCLWFAAGFSTRLSVVRRQIVCGSHWLVCGSPPASPPVLWFAARYWVRHRVSVVRRRVLWFAALTTGFARGFAAGFTVASPGRAPASPVAAVASPPSASPVLRPWLRRPRLHGVFIVTGVFIVAGVVFSTFVFGTFVFSTFVFSAFTVFACVFNTFVFSTFVFSTFVFGTAMVSGCS